MVTLSFENANVHFIEAIKELAYQANIKVTETSHKENRLKKAIQEIENGEYERYESIEEYEKAMND